MAWWKQDGLGLVQMTPLSLGDLGFPNFLFPIWKVGIWPP